MASAAVGHSSSVFQFATFVVATSAGIGFGGEGVHHLESPVRPLVKRLHRVLGHALR